MSASFVGMDPGLFILVICLIWGACIFFGVVEGIGKNRLFEGLIATLLLGVIGLIWILSVKAKVICPECKGKVDADAKRCRYCGHEFLSEEVK